MQIIAFVDGVSNILEIELFFSYMEGRTTEDTATDRHAYVRRASTLINSVPSYCGAQQDAVLALHVTLPIQEVMKHVDMSVYRLSCKTV